MGGGGGGFGGFLCPPQAPLKLWEHPLPLSPGSSSPPTLGSKPLESRLHDGGGWGWGALNLGLETSQGQQKGLRTPLPYPPPHTPHAPVPEAAVCMTSSHKHALFLRKWKVSEVWWGLGVCSSSSQGSPLPDSPPERGPDWGESVSCDSHSHPPLPLPQILRNQKSWGEAVSPRGRGWEVMTPGDGKNCQERMPLRRWQGARCITSIFSLPLPPLASPFLLLSPVVGQT